MINNAAEKYFAPFDGDMYLENQAPHVMLYNSFDFFLTNNHAVDSL
jgi:hypothetical protein